MVQISSGRLIAGSEVVKYSFKDYHESDNSLSDDDAVFLFILEGNRWSHGVFGI